MRRFLSLFTMLMLCGVLAFAQTRVVSGKVTDNTGKPVPFASVLIKGKGTGVQTDVNGEYSIRINQGDVLQISQLNYDLVEVPVGAMTNVNTTLELKTNTIKEVIVTSAFNIKRTARSTASNVQNVSSDALNTVRQSNINNALAGKVAGIQVRSQSSAALGRDNIVRLRGENSFGVGSGALYVVDGTPIASANDINVDDIEDVNVLQGPAAAALFGSQGSNGAIVVTTKKAKRGTSALGIEINSGVQFDKVYILPAYQNSYVGGSSRDWIRFNYRPGMPEGWKNLDGKFYYDFQEDVSWGPRLVEGQEYLPWYAFYGGHERSYKSAFMTKQTNNARDYFNTGVSLINNIAFSKSAENYNLRVSYTNFDQKGLIPNSWLKKNTLNVSGSIDLGTKFTLATNINYIDQKSNAENDDSYANNSTGSFNQWFHRDLDINILRELRGLKTTNGVLASWNLTNPNSYDPGKSEVKNFGAFYWFNPFAWQDNVSNSNNRQRLFGDISLTYKATNDLKFKFTYRKQQLNTNSDTRQYKNLENSASSSSAGYNYWEVISGRSATWQGYGLGYSTSDRQNFEFTTSYSKKIKDFNINADAGLVIQKNYSNVFIANTMGGLVIPDVFSLSNSKNPILVNNPANNPNPITRSKSRGLFILANVGWRNMVFLEGTYRKDYSSTEAFGYDIDTKSLGLSFVFSDLINKRGATFLSYGKLRAATGQVLNTLGVYQNSALYQLNPLQWSQGGTNYFLMTEFNNGIDPKVHGATNTEKEIGLELRFLKNRIGLTATYWNRKNKDFPITTANAQSSGYSSTFRNAGEISKTGVDLQAFVIPVKRKNIEWNINATWGRLIKNEVVSLFPNLDRISSEVGGNGNITMVSEVGKPWGQLRGKGFKRVNGIKVIDTNGDYVEDPNDINFGSSLPDYTGGVQSALTLFKNFTININIDYSYGGKFFSLSHFYGANSGLLDFTAGVNDKGNPIRDKVEDGGGVHLFGWDEATSKPIDYYVDARHYFEQNVYGKGIVEDYIYDMTFVKLRELSLGYKLPVQNMGKIGKYVKNATFSIVCRNPWLIYTKVKGFDTSELSDNSGEQGQFPGTRSMGVNLKIGF